MRAQLTSPWLRTFHTPAAGRTVICFPHAGGTANYFASWAQYARAGTGFATVQYPGRADRITEPFLTDIAVLADRIAEALEVLPGPLVLFGHSLGAAVAHEVAIRLRDRGTVLGLGVSAHHGPADLQPVTEHMLPDAELWEAVRKLNGTDRAIIAEDQLRELLLPVFRHDFRLAASYRPDPGVTLAVPVIASVGDRDLEVTPEQMVSWRRVTTGAFTLRVFPDGDHFYIGPAARELMRCLGAQFPELTWPSMP